ncbi:MAG: FtsX-like permease family protein, partial [Bryobacteraceae bacterium]
QAVAGRRRFALRNLIVVAPVSVSLVLLIAAALSVKSFFYAQGFNPGFRSDHVLLMSFDPTLLRYTESQTKTFYENLLDHVRSTPGVVSASLAEMVPMAPDVSGKSLYVQGYALPPDQNNISMLGSAVGADYFATMRIPILRGRAFDNRDTAASPKVVIVNETMASKYWPHQNPIGKSIRLNDRNGPEAQVVGVAKDGKYLYLAESRRHFIYLPFAQDYHPGMILHVLTQGDPANLASQIRAEVRSLDPDLPAFDVRTLHEFLDAKALLGPRLVAQMIGGIGLIGMLMAVIGLYGVVAYAVSRRTREIGIRMAMGAGKRDVLNMILAQGMGLTLIGVGIGLALAFAVTRFMGPLLLFGVNPADPLVFTLIPAILIAVTIAACWLPARRAAKVDPMIALRYE